MLSLLVYFLDIEGALVTRVNYTRVFFCVLSELCSAHWLFDIFSYYP